MLAEDLLTLHRQSGYVDQSRLNRIPRDCYRGFGFEPKDAMKARGLDSPDIGDCLAMSHSVKVLARKPALPPVYSYPCLSDTARWMH